MGTEHLLLGLVQLYEDHDADVAHVLSQHGADPETVRDLVVEQLPENIADTAPGMDTGKPKVTPRMILVYEYSLQLAIELDHQCAGTLHLLLGMLYEKAGIGNKVLLQFGITSRSALQSAANRPSTEVPLPEPFVPTVRKTPGVVRVSEYARQMAMSDASEENVGTHHYLLAMIVEQEGLAARALASLGITYEALKTKIGELNAAGTSDDAQGYQALLYNSEEQYSEEKYGEPVTVARDELDILVERLPGILPAGTPLAFNTDEQGAWIQAGEGVNLEHYIRRALGTDSI